MSISLTRRQLAGAVVGAAAAVRPVPAAEGPRDEDALARKSVRDTGEALAKFEIAATLEPSFTFRP